MERTSVADFACSIARTLDLVGEWWTPLILRDLFLGIDRFDELQRDLGLASNVLSARLKKLVDAGIVHKQPLPEDGRAVRYVLTERGRDLYPVLLALMAWGDKWLAGDAGQPLQVVHSACGAVTAAVPHCSVCGRPMALHDIEFRPGPGGRYGAGTAVIAERFASSAAGYGSTASPPTSGRKRGR
ncbi:helix-turn-helix transcriptional regulator [Aquincola sp. S2]|uniref:Helix-turn-helix transcriptional regulator n=1 Tax=Pseudaquabacterium terrae TaxID=2732868 RepID=A0ABX2EE61_9BURK|nr:helix-turn-helix domain-containing protein [Aquabacterium terrae]NRF66912.1 helix-turn-helix transcriptional regulator [Aquabacterium terrae]